MGLGSAIQCIHLRGKDIHPRVAILWRGIYFFEGSAAGRAVAAKAGVETLCRGFILLKLRRICHLSDTILLTKSFSFVWWKLVIITR